MKSLRKKMLTKIILATVMAGCVGYSGLAQAEIIDMTAAENLAGVTITNPTEEVNNTYIYKWDEAQQSLTGGNILVTSNQNIKYINAKIVVDKNNLPDMSTATVSKVVEQLVSKVQSQLESRSYYISAEVCICDGTSEKAEVLRSYKVLLKDVDEGNTDIGKVGDFNGASYKTPLTNTGKKTSEYDFVKNKLHLGNGNYIIAPDFSQPTKDHIYKAVFNSARDMTVTSREDGYTAFNTITIIADATADPQSKVYGIYNGRRNKTELFFTNTPMITVKGNEAVGAYAGGKADSRITLGATSGDEFNLIVEGTEQSYGLEAGQDGTVALVVDSGPARKLNIDVGNGIGLYAHDGGQVISATNINGKTITEGNDSTVITTTGGVLAFAEKGGQIKGFHLSVLDGILQTDDAPESLIDITLLNKNKVTTSGDVQGNIKLFLVGGNNSNSPFTWSGNFNSTNTMIIGKNAIWSGSSQLDAVNEVNVQANGIWNLKEQQNLPLVKHLVGSESIAQRGYINMGTKDIIIDEYTGNVTFVYQHNIDEVENIEGGKIAISKVMPLTITTSGLGDDKNSTSTSIKKSTIILTTDSSGINLDNVAEVNKVLDGLANKLTYTNYACGERNLTGSVEISEGLTSASVTKKSSRLTFDEQTGQAGREEKVLTPYTDKIMGDINIDKAYKDVIRQDEAGNLVYSFDKDVYILDKTTKDPRFFAQGGLFFGSINNYGDKKYNNNGRNSLNGPSYTLDMQGHDLNIETIVSPLTGSTGSQPMWTTGAIFGVREGNITIDNPGKIDINYNANFYYGGAISVGSAIATPKGVHVIINNDNDPAHAVRVRGGITTPGYELDYAAIKASSQDGSRNTIEISGLVDLETKHSAVLYANKGESYISIGGGRLVTPDYDAIMTSGTGARVDVNILKDEAGKVLGAGTNTVVIEGGVATATDFWGNDGTINLGLTTADSSLTGGIHGAGNHRSLWLQNGATWNNQAYNKHWWSDGSVKLVDKASTVNNLYGGESMAQAGIINHSSNEQLTIDQLTGAVELHMLGSGDGIIENYQGEANVFYKHDAENPVQIEGGQLTINRAAPASNVNLITDNVGIDVDNSFQVHDVLTSLAKQLTYQSYVEGERNLDGYVQIAEGLTSSSMAKRTGAITFNEEDGVGSLTENSVQPVFSYPNEQTIAEFNTAILGSAEEDMDYVKGGVRNLDDNIYTFTQDRTVINADNNLIAGGPWLAKIASVVSGGNAERSVVLDLQGNSLEINGINKDSHSTGITAIGEDAVVEVKNIGELSVNVDGGGQTAALFVNGGGRIKIENDGGGYLIVRGNAAQSINGALIKSMNGKAGVRSWLTIDGLIDLSANIVDNEGIGEGLSAVASTIEVGGGKIIMNDDGSGETNFGGGNSFAIRAYGEFVTQNYGIVNVNVIKEADTAEAKAIGAGDKVTQIVGDFSTRGGMGTNGIINVGLNTEDSYWYGDYSAGSGFGVTPGDYGCLNLFMGNGARWEGYTRYATNLQMDNGAVWRGYSHDNDNLDMSLKNDAQWIATTAGVGDTNISKVRNFNGAGEGERVGSIFMSDANAVDVVVDNYTGKTMLLYQHDAENPATIIGGSFTINKAAEGSEISLVTDNVGIDTDNRFHVNDVLNSLAKQLTYQSYVEGERNLDGYVQIAEGLTSSSVAKRTGSIAFSEEDGSGSLKEGSIQPDFIYPTEQTISEFNVPILGSTQEDMQYVEAGVRNLEENIYTFTQDKTVINVDSNLIAGGPWLGQIASAVSGASAEKSLVLDLQGNSLEINGVNKNSHSTGITAIGKDAIVEVKNIGELSVNVEGGGQTAGLFVNGGGRIKIANADGGTLIVRGNAARSINGALIKAMNGQNGVRSWIAIDGMVDLSANIVNDKGIGEGLSAVASTIEVGGGKIIMNDDGSGETNFGGGNSFAIRAYGEFASQNYGIVNVNVIKEADTADAKAIGAGDRVTQIVGDFSTQGGMGTNGIINVGLNTEDSYWYGDYSAGSGFGVTPGDYGCLNLFMGNGAHWEGYTQYATNLQMDSGAVWRGYSYDNDNLDMSLKNDAQWVATTAGVGDTSISRVRNFNGAGKGERPGSIFMSDADAVDVVVDNYTGKTMLLYQHDAENPTTIIGGSFTINKAGEGSEIVLSTDNVGIDVHNPDVVKSTLNSLAGKLYYQGAVEGENNLQGQVQIAEGLLSSSAAVKLGRIGYRAGEAEGGQGFLEEGSVITPEIKHDADIIYGDSETAMMRGAKSAMASTVMLWRSEADDLMKRLGDLRLRPLDQGIWAKYYGGKYSMDDQKTSFDTKYSAYQVGYDQAIGNGWLIGSALSYNDGESNYSLGSGDNEAISLAAYGILLQEDGTYVDIIVKRSKLENDYSINNVYGHALQGDYKTWATSFSAEYGKRMELDNGLYIDPSLEVTLGRVEGKSYDASSDYLDAYGKRKSLKVQQDDCNSLIGRVGIKFGQQLDNASYYCKFTAAHEFDGDFTTSFKADGEPDGRTKLDLGDTWYELQLGGSIMLSDNSLLYASYERSFSGDLEEKWRADAGLRWSF